MSGYKLFLDANFNPVPKDKATLIKIVEDSGRVTFIHPNKPTPNVIKARDVRPAWAEEADLPPTPAERAAQPALFSRLIAKWKWLLLLDEWEITFTIKEDVPRVDQGIIVSWTEKKGEIELSSRLTPKTAEEDISHEMLHLILYHENWYLDSHADEMLRRKAISKDEYTAIQENYNLAQNSVIEHLKRIFAKAGIGNE